MYKKNDSKMLSSLSMIQFKFIPSKPNTETSISYILTSILLSYPKPLVKPSTD